MVPRRVAVAASGGRDSTALLHATVRAAAPLGVQVLALHVHHGLQPAADDWLDLVRGQARRWGASFDSRRLLGKPAAGESVEAWARRERYRALAEMAHAAGCSLVLLAHHRRDQAETWLLQALRGGGPRGLSAMPVQAQRRGLNWARPWLDHPREAIEAYVRRHRLRYADDASNAEPRYARNALRQAVWPALAKAFPDAETTLAAAARQAQGAARLAEEVAALDLPPLLRAGALDVAPWSQLPPARRLNTLQAWLTQALQGPAPASLLQRLFDELPACRSGRWPAPEAELRLYRGLLKVAEVLPLGLESPAAQCIDLDHPCTLDLPAWGGRLLAVAVDRGGAAPAALRQITVAARLGGERFRLAPAGLPRSLKKQFQARAVPAWERDGPLLLTADGRLLFVPGLGIDAALQAPPGEPQLLIQWQPSLPGPRQAGP